MTKVIIVEPEALQSMIDASVQKAFATKGVSTNDPNPQSGHFTVKQAATFLDLAPQTIYGLTSRNEIPHYKRGKKLYFLKAELEKWMLENRRPQIQKSVDGRNPFRKRKDR